MKIDLNLVPHYLVLRGGFEPYVLNAQRCVLRRGASYLLRAFARTRGMPTSIMNDAWNDFSSVESITPSERADARAYLLVLGAESQHQLALLLGL